MSLQARIEADIKQAMLARQNLVRDTLRMVLADLKNKRIELGQDLGAAEELAVVKRAVKTRTDSAEQYEQGGRDDLASQERAEIAVLEAYLPQMLSEDETRSLVQAVVRELGIDSKKDMGALMKTLMARHKSELDGRLVQKVAAELLG